MKDYSACVAVYCKGGFTVHHCIVRRRSGEGGGGEEGRTKPLVSGVTCGEDYSLRGHMDGFYGSMM
jgi:hypothetical protein